MRIAFIVTGAGDFPRIDTEQYSAVSNTTEIDTTEFTAVKTVTVSAPQQYVKLVRRFQCEGLTLDVRKGPDSVSVAVCALYRIITTGKNETRSVHIGTPDTSETLYLIPGQWLNDKS